MAFNSSAIRMSNILGNQFKGLRLKEELNNLLIDLGYDTELDFLTGNGAVDIYLPTRRTMIEIKGFGLACPNYLN